MGRTTFDLPDAVHNDLAATARDRKKTMGKAIEEAVLLWLDTPKEDIAEMSGPFARMSDNDRKKVERYIELLNTADERMKTLIHQMIKQLLEIAQRAR